MLTEKRHTIILALLKEKEFVKISELIDKTNSSQSTIRRDLAYLESIDALKRVHGGAKLIDLKHRELTYKEKTFKNIQEKQQLGKYAASLISDGECIFIDAGTSTYTLIENLKDKNIFVVTNGLKHIDLLIDNNIKCYMLGGSVKSTTKAVIGGDALRCLSKFRFDKCFLGTNGIDTEAGFTTPDCEEAIIKQCAINNSKHAFVIADSSKFSEVSFVKFGDVNNCTIITSSNNNLEKYKKLTEIKVVDTK